MLAWEWNIQTCLLALRHFPFFTFFKYGVRDILLFLKILNVKSHTFKLHAFFGVVPYPVTIQNNPLESFLLFINQPWLCNVQRGPFEYRNRFHAHERICLACELRSFFAVQCLVGGRHVKCADQRDPVWIGERSGFVPQRFAREEDKATRVGCARVLPK